MIAVLRRIAARAATEVAREYEYFAADAKPRKLLFDHLPKCGGSSLNRYLEAHYPRRKVFSMNGLNPRGSVDRFKGLPRHRRHGFDLIKGHLAHELLGYVHPDCLKVTVLREPVDRAVSQYYYAKSTEAHYLYAEINESQMTLANFAANGLSERLRNWYTSHFSGLTVEEAEERPQESVELAASVISERYDVVGFLDDFAGFAKVLRGKAGLRREYRDMRVNVGKARPRLADIERSILEKIGENNHLDVLLYRRMREAVESR